MSVGQIVPATIILTLLLGTPSALAKFDSEGVKVELSVGQPSVTIENPDSTKAGYTGLSAMGRGFFPLFGGDVFRTDFTTSIKYLDLSNTANGAQKEYAQYIGPGLGFQLSISRFFVGADYFYLKGRHSAVGTFSNHTEFDISGLDYHAGMRFQFGTGSLGFAISQMSSTIPGSSTNLSKDSPWSDQVYWIQFSYSFKTSTGNLIRSIFGK